MEPSAGPESTPATQPYGTAQFAKVVSAVRELKHPTQIGPYTILELIAEGGMGSVYKAEQRQPIHRIVAVKVIKLGMDTREVIARFESERQALALMDHPNVAKVLDAGATETGRPYFVMEYVRGEPITTSCDRHKLTMPQRLELFTQACAAIQHAHQKAIIHRDLKPSNILVTLVDDKPQVKVIDFGVAKAISRRLTERSLFTESGQLVGTPEYMAPEQAEGTAMLDTDTRSDVYSLGVVLYELLTGALPFEPTSLRSAGYNEIQRIIREVDPPRPSTRLSRLGAQGAAEVARLRQTSLEVLERQLRSELEWIPLRAMHKDRARRYASATELAEDILNYLSNRPLRAAPDSAAYRLRKFLRRNKTVVAASAAMVFLLLAGITATTWQAIRATRAERNIRAEQQRTLEQKRQAEAATAAANQVNSFLVEMLQSPDPWRTQAERGKPVLVRDVLDRAAEGVATKFRDQPRVEASVRSALGLTYRALGLYDQALPHLSEALNLYRRLGGEDDPETLDAQKELGQLLHKQGRLDEAHDLYQDELDRRLRIYGENHIETAGATNNVAVILQKLGKFAEAEQMYLKARERYIALAGPDHAESMRITGNLGQLYEALGREEESEALLRESYERRRRVLGPDHPDTITIQSRYAFALRRRGNEGEVMMRDAFERARKVFGEDHPNTVIAEQGLAIVLNVMGRREESFEVHRDALARSRRALGNEDADTLMIARTLGVDLANAGHTEEASPLLREAYVGLKKVLGADHPRTLQTTHAFATILQKQSKYDEGLAPAKELFDLVREPGKIQIDPRVRAQFMCLYGTCLTGVGRHAEAIDPLLEARAAMYETGQPMSQHLAAVVSALAKSSRGLGREADAERYLAELAPINAATRPATQPGTRPATPPGTNPSH
jgi:serine/threonine protein kinase